MFDSHEAKTNVLPDRARPPGGRINNVLPVIRPVWQIFIECLMQLGIRMRAHLIWVFYDMPLRVYYVSLTCQPFYLCTRNRVGETFKSL